MVKVIRRFFDFCGETNRKKFVTSIWLGVLIALFEALKIPAIAVMMRALLPVDLGGNGGVTTPDAPMEDVVAAAKKACCHDFITALPEGYETVIGEGGANLSGGERQRISIARAMMKDAPVIFLDEATANVDPENENELTKAIEALTKEKTVIMIAHRLKTVEHADQILVVDHGKIVQRGTHEQLMAEEGIYKTFVGERREAASWKVKK